MSPHYVCAVRDVVCVVGGVHIWWATCLCIHSCICGRFSWSAIQYNSIQGRSLQISSIPSRLLSSSAAPGFWGDVVRAASQDIQWQNHSLYRKIGWGAIHDAIDQVSWLPRSNLPFRVAYTTSHWWVCRTAVSHIIHGEYQSKATPYGLMVGGELIKPEIKKKCRFFFCCNHMMQFTLK